MADLGKISFSVETAGLKQGEQALDSFNQKQKEVAQGAKDFNAAQASTVSATQQAINAQEKLNTSTTATGKSFGFLQSTINGIRSLFGIHTRSVGDAANASEEMARSHGHATSATMAFREAVHTLDPVLLQMGGTMGALGPLVMAARAGMLGLAAAITGSVIVALEKAADDTELLKSRLTALTGTGGGTTFFNEFKAGADRANTSVGNLEQSVDALLRNGIQSASKTVSINAETGGLDIFENAFFAGALNAKNIADFGVALSQAFQMGGETASTAATDVKAFVDELVKSGGLTKDLFDTLREKSPEASNLLLRAFVGGAAGLSQFRANLVQTPLAIDEVVRRISNSAAQGDTAFKQYMATGQTVAQAFDRLKTSASSLFSAMSATGQIHAASQAISELADDLKSATGNAQAALNVLKLFGALGIGAAAFAVFGGLPATIATAVAGLHFFKPEIEDFIKSLGGGDIAVTAFTTTLKLLTAAAVFAVNPFAGIMVFLLEFRNEIAATITKIKEFLTEEGKMIEARSAQGAAAISGMLEGGSSFNPFSGTSPSSVPVASDNSQSVVGKILNFLSNLNPISSAGAAELDNGGTQTALANVPPQLNTAKASADALAQSISTLTDNFGSLSKVVGLFRADTFTTFADSGVAAFAKLEAAASAAAQSVAANVAKIAQSLADSIARMNSSVASGGPNISFQVGGVTEAATPSGGGSESTVTSGLTDTTGIVFPPDNLFNFATGGLTKVTGIGGTDSQLVQFMATPGEVVAVGNPAQPGQSATLQSAIDQTSAIQIGQPTVSLPQVNSSLQNFIDQTNATSGQSPSDQIVTALDGTKTTVADAIQKMNDNVTRLLSQISSTQQTAATSAANAASSTSATTAAASTATAKPASLIGGGPFSGVGNPSPLLASQIAAAKADAAYFGQPMPASQFQRNYNLVANPAGENGAPFAQPANTGTARFYGAGKIISDIPQSSPRGGTLVSGLGQYFGGTSDVIGGSSSYANDNSSSFLSNYFNSATSSPSLYSEGPYLSDMSGISDSGSSFMDYFNSVGQALGGYDNPYQDTSSSYDPYGGGYGSSSADYTDMGYFATGGTFTVGSYNGKGGTDSQYIGMHVTPGEKVSVDGGDKASNDNAQSIGGYRKTVEFTVRIPPAGPPRYVAGRAELARAMGGR